MFSQTQFNGISSQQAKSIQQDFIEGNWQLIKEDKAKYMAAGENYIIKIFKTGGISENIKSIFIGARHQRFANGSKLLNSIQIKNPKVVCWGKYKGQPYLFMEIIQGEAFGDFLHSFFHQPDKSTLIWKRTLLKAIAQMICSMHKQNIVHGDLRANNILLHNNQGTLELCLIDNERTRKVIRKHREKQRNLVQIMMLSRDGFTCTDHLRFLHYYLSEMDMSPAQKKKYIREVLAKLEKRLTEKNRIITGRKLPEKVFDELLSCSLS